MAKKTKITTFHYFRCGHTALAVPRTPAGLVFVRGEYWKGSTSAV